MSSVTQVDKHTINGTAIYPHYESKYVAYTIRNHIPMASDSFVE
jgi:hypothetical protein